MGFIDIRVGGKSLVLANPKVQLVKRGFALENEIVLGSYTMPMEAPVCFENEQIFGHQYLLESDNSTPVIENADLFIGGDMQSRGYLLLLSANAKAYRFSFIYKPISNIFFNRPLRELSYDNTKFWRGNSVPVTHTEYMDFLDNVVQEVDAYVPGGLDTFCLFPVKCPSWVDLPDGVVETDGFGTDNTKRRLNLFSGVANALVRNFIELSYDDLGSGINHDISALFTSLAINDQKIVPFLYTAFLLEEIWRIEGWKVAGTLIQHEDFLRDVLINSYAIDRYAPAGSAFFNWNNTALAVGARLPLNCTYQFKNYYNNATNRINIPSGDVIISGAFPSVMVKMDVYFYFVNDVTGKSITIELYDEIFATHYYVGTGIGSGNVLIVSVLSRDGAVTCGMNVDREFSYRIQSTDIPVPDQVLESISAIMYFCAKDGSYEWSNVLDTTVEYKNHVPDINVGEFIKSIIKRFGCTQEYDFANKTVYYNIIEESIQGSSGYDMTNIMIKDSYEKEISDFFVKGIYANQIEFNYDTSTHKIGVENAYTEQFLFDIPGCTLLSKFQGTYKLPHFGTTGASKQLARDFSEGLIYIHYKGLQVGSDGLYPAPYASASKLISDDTKFSAYDMALSYIIPFYWATYLSAKANPVRFNLIMNIAILNNFNLFKLITGNYQKYFAEEMIVEVEEKGITNCEIKVYQL
jgi:hypothetical protein